MLVRGRRVRVALTNLDGINGMGVRFRDYVHQFKHPFYTSPVIHKQERGDSCYTLAPFSFLLLNFSGMGQDLREHTIYAFIHGAASTDSGVPFFWGGEMIYHPIYPIVKEHRYNKHDASRCVTFHLPTHTYSHPHTPAPTHVLSIQQASIQLSAKWHAYKNPPSPFKTSK
jgi:hypothetical protein